MIVNIFNQTEYCIEQEFNIYKKLNHNKNHSPYNFVELRMIDNLDNFKNYDSRNELIFMIYKISDKLVSFPVISLKNVRIILVDESEINGHFKINVRGAKILCKSLLMKYIYGIIDKNFNLPEFCGKWEKILPYRLPFSLINQVILCSCGEFHLNHPCLNSCIKMKFNKKLDFETTKYISDNFIMDHPTKISQFKDYYIVGNYKIETANGDIMKIIYEKNKKNKVKKIKKIRNKINDNSFLKDENF